MKNAHCPIVRCRVGPRPALMYLWSALFVLWTPGVARAQDSGAEALRVVQLQRKTDLVLWAGPAGSAMAISPAKVERVPGYPSALMVWQVFPTLDHAHPFTVAKVGGRLLRLGGFPAPELDEATRGLRWSITDRTKALELAQVLARLGDRFGARRYVFTSLPPVDETLVRVRNTWRSRAPADWPTDSVWSAGAGSWGVALTILSQDTRSFNQRWVAIAYSFYVDPHGVLTSWAWRSSDPFNVP